VDQLPVSHAKSSKRTRSGKRMSVLPFSKLTIKPKGPCETAPRAGKFMLMASGKKDEVARAKDLLE
jgi:hypothetical protein